MSKHKLLRNKSLLLKVSIITAMLLLCLVITFTTNHKQGPGFFSALAAPKVERDPHLQELEKLIEEYNCDEKWAQDVINLGAAFKKDNKATYLSTYYNQVESLQPVYTKISVNLEKLGTDFSTKQYEAARTELKALQTNYGALLSYEK